MFHSLINKNNGLEPTCVTLNSPKPHIKNKKFQAMAHCGTVLSQIVRIFPRHEFQALANKHHAGQKFRSFSRWVQFVALLTVQLTGRNSLRDITDNIAAQGAKRYHLGVRPFSRATWDRANETQPHQIYEALFQQLLARSQSCAPRKRFKFKQKLFLLDASMIDLTRSLFPWAKYRKEKGAGKTQECNEIRKFSCKASTAYTVRSCIWMLRPTSLTNLCPTHWIFRRQRSLNGTKSAGIPEVPVEGRTLHAADVTNITAKLV